MSDKSIILEQAKEEEKNGNYQIDLNLLEQIFDIKDFSVVFEYAKTLYVLKKYDGALDIFLKLYNKNADDANVIDFNNVWNSKELVEYRKSIIDKGKDTCLIYRKLYT